MPQDDRVKHRVDYEAITERNRENLATLQALSRKSPWKKWYKAIRPRDLSATLLNAFRIGVRDDNGDRTTDAAAWSEQVRSVSALALQNPSHPTAARAIEHAIYEARRINGLMNPERRASRPTSATDPDPQLSAHEHSQIENIFRSWLLDTLHEVWSSEARE
jgi:hypothetical protein